MTEKQEKIELSVSIWNQLLSPYYSLKLLAIGKLSRRLLGEPGTRLFGDLRTFCCFIGHGRSGSSLVGALLNAHPNIVMSNELNAFRRLSHGLTADQLYGLIYIVSQRQARRGSMGGGNYSYAVRDQWQGQHRDIHVIGDRKAGATAWEVSENPELLGDVIDKIPHKLKIIHVVRNPFDVIATTFRKNPPKRNESARQHLNREIRNHRLRCSAVKSVETALGGESFYSSYHENLIDNPVEEISRICGFLGVVPSSEYLNDCANIINRKPNPSRQSIDWDPDSIQLVRSTIDDFDWFENNSDGLGPCQDV